MAQIFNFKNKICYANDGTKFASKAERTRYEELKLLEKSHLISNLRTQVRYQLIPSQFEEVKTTERYKAGVHKGEFKVKRVCVEQGLYYVADFVYLDNVGREIVEDVKGATGSYARDRIFAYRIFCIKKKLMLFVHGIKIREVVR